MSVIFNRKTRRQFLVGSGKSLLALPFLPSLFGSDAAAQAAFIQDRRLMVMCFGHANPKEYWLDRSVATTPVGSFGAKEKLLRSLSSNSDLSPMLSHSLYNQLRLNDQISVIRGLRTIISGGHGHGSMSGNQKQESGTNVTAIEGYPTFDHVIESSRALYPSTTPANVTKAMRVNLTGGNFLFLKKVGDIVSKNTNYGFDSNQYFQNTNYYTLPVFYRDIFKGLTNGSVPDSDTTNFVKTNILNKVYESFGSFKANRKISKDDFSKLDQHMGYISDLQQSLAVLPQTMSCNLPIAPLPDTNPMVYEPLYFKLMALAFKCGLSKFGVIEPAGDPNHTPNLTLPQGVGFHGVVHGGDPAYQSLKGPAYLANYTYNYNLLAEHFLKPLSELEGNTGRTYVDNMITAVITTMSIESVNGGSGHFSHDLQHSLIGSMGGQIRSGRYINFPSEVTGGGRSLPNNAFTVTLLDLLGIPRSEYSALSSSGKGYGYYDYISGNPYNSRLYDSITELL